MKLPYTGELLQSAAGLKSTRDDPLNNVGMPTTMMLQCYNRGLESNFVYMPLRLAHRQPCLTGEHLLAGKQTLHRYVRFSFPE
jgi:hypothetical protein